MKKRALTKTKKAKRTKPKKQATAKRTAAKAEKPIGVVTHFYTNIRVAIVRFTKKVSSGTKLHYRGATTDFIDAAKSMQYDHKEIKVAPKGKQIGIKVKKRVREEDRVYLAE